MSICPIGFWADLGCQASLWDFSEEDTTSIATVGFRVDSDGDVYTKPDSSTGYTSLQTWIGECAASSYECLIDGVGDNPTHTGSGTGSGENQWLPCSSDQKWEWSASFTPEEWSGVLQIRRTSDNKVVAECNITMTCL